MAKQLKIAIFRRPPKMSDQDFFAQFLRCEAAEVVAPCAQRYQVCSDLSSMTIDNVVDKKKVTNEMLDVLEQSTWATIPAGKTTNRFIVAGANNPFGKRGASSGSLV